MKDLVETRYVALRDHLRIESTIERYKRHLVSPKLVGAAVPAGFTLSVVYLVHTWNSAVDNDLVAGDSPWKVKNEEAIDLLDQAFIDVLYWGLRLGGDDAVWAERRADAMFGQREGDGTVEMWAWDAGDEKFDFASPESWSARRRGSPCGEADLDASETVSGSPSRNYGDDPHCWYPFSSIREYKVR